MRSKGNTLSNALYNPNESLHPAPTNTSEFQDRDGELEKFIRRKYVLGSFKADATGGGNGGGSPSRNRQRARTSADEGNRYTPSSSSSGLQAPNRRPSDHVPPPPLPYAKDNREIRRGITDRLSPNPELQEIVVARTKSTPLPDLPPRSRASSPSGSGAKGSMNPPRERPRPGAGLGSYTGGVGGGDAGLYGTAGTEIGMREGDWAAAGSNGKYAARSMVDDSWADLMASSNVNVPGMAGNNMGGRTASGSGNAQGQQGYGQQVPQAQNQNPFPSQQQSQLQPQLQTQTISSYPQNGSQYSNTGTNGYGQGMQNQHGMGMPSMVQNQYQTQNQNQTQTNPFHQQQQQSQQFTQQPFTPSPFGAQTPSSGMYTQASAFNGNGMPINGYSNVNGMPTSNPISNSNPFQINMSYNGIQNPGLTAPTSMLMSTQVPTSMQMPMLTPGGSPFPLAATSPYSSFSAGMGSGSGSGNGYFGQQQQQQQQMGMGMGMGMQGYNNGAGGGGGGMGWGQ